MSEKKGVLRLGRNVTLQKRSGLRGTEKRGVLQRSCLTVGTGKRR